MNIEKTLLGPGGTIPHRFLEEMGVDDKELLTVIHGKMGLIILKESETLTDLLSNLLGKTGGEWIESEYSQYLLERNK